MSFKSMTGYGRASINEKHLQISIEILSVNRKHLDINIVLPKHLTRFDPKIRKKLAESITRGHITVRIFVTFLESTPLQIIPNLAIAKQIYQGWEKIASHIGKNETIPLTILERESDLFHYEETEEMEKLSPFILKAVDSALIPFLKMRLEEGKVLQEDIFKRTKLLTSCIQIIENESKKSEGKYHEKIFNKLKELLPLIEAKDDRLIKECALMAEKLDISEEITRFSSHLKQLQNILEKGCEFLGKTVEFLLQELAREANTMGSKSSSITIIEQVLLIKKELDRIKEQVQNVE